MPLKRRTTTRRRRMRGRGILDTIKKAARSVYGFARSNVGTALDYAKRNQLISSGLSALADRTGIAPLGLLASGARYLGYGRRRKRTGVRRVRRIGGRGLF